MSYKHLLCNMAATRARTGESILPLKPPGFEFWDIPAGGGEGGICHWRLAGVRDLGAGAWEAAVADSRAVVIMIGDTATARCPHVSQKPDKEGLRQSRP